MNDPTEVLRDAWDVAENAYRRGRINSERTLQAILHAHLSNALPDHLVMCEPMLAAPGGFKVAPDLVLAEGRRIVLVAEIKFKPQAYPEFKEDLNKLSLYGGNFGPIFLSVEPKTGHFTSDEFIFSDDCVLAFLSISRHDAVCADGDFLKSAMGNLGHRFISLAIKVGA